MKRFGRDGSLRDTFTNGPGEKLMLPRLDEADKFVELHWKPATLTEKALPNGPYPIRRETLESVIASGGEVQIHDMLRGLMDWLDVTDKPEQATTMIHDILSVHYPWDGRREASCTFQSDYGHLYRFLIGDIDTGGPLIAWQRRDWLMMVAAPSEGEPGRLLVAAPRAISRQAARSIVNHSATIDMGEPADSYALALASRGRTSNIYSWAQGQVTLVGWEHGLGTSVIDGKLEPSPNMLPDHDWLPTNQLAMLIAIGADYA